jgi:hypothetical protein
MIRLSVTDLDGYMYWRESEDMELSELIERLRGQQEPTTQMLAGRAFHKLFEQSGEQEVTKVTVDDYEFVFAIDEELALPPVRELKAEIVFNTSVGPVTLVGKVDALDGIVVHDYKLTERFDVERYTDSYQWRSYLCMFNAASFVYDVFVGRYDGTHVYIHDYHRMAFHAYPGMMEDVRVMVDELARIVAKHVPEKIMQEAA